MTRKKYPKQMRAHFTAYYLQHRKELGGWIGNAYKTIRDSRPNNMARALAAVQKALPLN